VSGPISDPGAGRRDVVANLDLKWVLTPFCLQILAPEGVTWLQTWI